MKRVITELLLGVLGEDGVDGGVHRGDLVNEVVGVILAGEEDLPRSGPGSGHGIVGPQLHKAVARVGR